MRDLKFFIFIIIILLLVMVILGGSARLTGSGLSMVNWDPVTTWFPPLSLNEWNKIFYDYCKSPEFYYVNWDINLDSFKSIFWLEYLHRLWGKLMFFPLLYGTVLVFISREFKFLKFRFFLIWLLSIFQGLIGWYMVKSGLVSDPYVSPYRLCFHMMLAVSIIFLFIWIYFDISFGKLSLLELPLLNLITIVFLLLTMFFGVLVAGLKAGLIYNTFPLMNGSLFPAEMGSFYPPWKDVLENPSTVQFFHRSLAILTFICVLYYSIIHLTKKPK